MIIKLRNLFAIILLINISLSAQEVKKFSMRGTVTDAITQEPLIGALCFIDKLNTHDIKKLNAQNSPSANELKS